MVSGASELRLSKLRQVFLPGAGRTKMGAGSGSGAGKKFPSP